MPIRKYIGIRRASKNIKRESKSPLKKTPLTAKCKTSIEPINPLLWEYFSVTEKKDKRVNIAVKNKSNRDIPEIPKVKLIP